MFSKAFHFMIIFLAVGLFRTLPAEPLRSSDQVTLAGRTIFRDGNLAVPDSLRLQVWRHGAELHDAWYEAADEVCDEADGWLVFHDQLQDIDGSGGEGQYLIWVGAYDADSALYTPFIYTFQVGLHDEVLKVSDSLHLIIDSLMAVLDTLQSQDDWISKLTAADNIGLDLDNVLGSLDSSEIGNGAVNSRVLASNAFGADQLQATAGIEIAYYVWQNSTRTVSGGWIDSNLSEKGLDSSHTAGAVWNTPQGNHQYPGSFGYFLDESVSSLGRGSGIYSYRIIAYDSTIDQVIPGVSIIIRNSDQSALLATGTCDLLGRADFNLDSDTLLVLAFSPGYTFGAYDTLIVAGSAVDTLFGTQFNPGTAAIPGLCRVYGFIYDIAGLPVSHAAVEARLPQGVVRTNGNIVSPLSIETETDSLGYFHLDLIPSAQLVPDTTRYEITVRLEHGNILRERVWVPDTGDWIITW